MRYKIMFFAFMMFLVSACEKEKIVTEYIENEFSWIEHSDINHEDKYLLNGYTNDHELFLVGDRNFIQIDKENKARIANFGKDTHNIKIPLSDDILMVMDEEENEKGRINFYYIPQLHTGNDERAILRLLQYDSNFKSFKNHDELLNIPFTSFNENHQVLIPYVGLSKHQCFALVTFAVNNDPSATDDILLIDNVKIIEIPIDNNVSEIVIQAIGNDFLIANYDIVAKVYSDGRYKAFDIQGFTPTRFFESENTLYAVAYNLIYTSNDNGESWQLMYEGSASLQNYFYAIVDDKIILANQSNVLELEFTSTGFQTKQLVNDGLEGHYITSISEFNEKVYVTTLSGLFYKDAIRFFDTKEVEVLEE